MSVWLSFFTTTSVTACIQHKKLWYKKDNSSWQNKNTQYVLYTIQTAVFTITSVD